MRFTSLALYSSLIVAAVSAHITNPDVGSSSSSSLLVARDASTQSPTVANFSLEKRDEEIVEVDIEVDDDDDDEASGDLEARGKHHKKKSHHRSHKHSGRRSGHKKKHHHNQNHTSAGGKFSGKGTFFKPNQGSCGKWNTANDKIVALSADIYQGGSHCFKGVRICHGSKCANAQVADLCPGCHHTSLDMTPSLFKELANPDLGVIDIQWSFV
ncbi:uncharacterized protein UTRI_03777_B [Ustilago trichophora]|uniref:RlpA-like protein double-psi beta-barrel domain-containing protein n=1 Tax=Ustilago trichophora TaxID=86804 RepID=A0A5C3E016_9BASI|nr:uncharacterized protein UTRI_03777_B [Ustilago trichophora]